MKSFWVLEYNLVSDLVHTLCVIIECYNKWSYVLGFGPKGVKEAAEVLWGSVALSVNSE